MPTPVFCLGTMTALTSTTHMPALGWRGVLMGMLMAVAVSDSPVAGKSPLDSTSHSHRSPDDVPSPSSRPGTVWFTPEPSHETTVTDSVLFQTGQPLEIYKSLKPSDLVVEDPQPSLRPVGDAVESSARQSEPPADWQLAWSNSSMSAANHSFVTVTPQPSLTSEPKVLDESKLTSLPGLPLEPYPMTDFPSDDSYNLGHALLEPGMYQDDNHILAPSYHVPFIPIQPTSPSSVPTEVFPEYFYPTNTMDFDWGSGDYMETISYLSPDGDDYSPLTKVPSDAFDNDDYTENYDTSFPSRVGLSLSTLPAVHFTPSLTPVFNTIHPSSHSPNHPALYHKLEPTPTLYSDIAATSYIEWSDHFSIHPTDVLLPDMNSLEYYHTSQLDKENTAGSGAEHRGNVTVVSLNATTPTPTKTSDDNSKEDEVSGAVSGLEPYEETTAVAPDSTESVSDASLHASVEPSSVLWSSQTPSTMDWSAGTPSLAIHSSSVYTLNIPDATTSLPDVMSSSSLMDIQWFQTEYFPDSTLSSTPVLTLSTSFTFVSTPQDSVTTDTPSLSSSTPNVTLAQPVMVGDEGTTKDEADVVTSMTMMPGSSEVNTQTAGPTTTTATTGSHQTAIATTRSATQTIAPRQYVCKNDYRGYLVKIGLPSAVTLAYAKTQVKSALRGEFNQSFDIQVTDPPPMFTFRVVSGPVVYTSISVVNVLRRSGRRFLSVSPNWTVPDHRFQVHTVLQFVPGHIDMRYCNFSESIERGLTKAFAEVRRRLKESTNFTVHILNITMAAPKNHPARPPVDITFTVRTTRGFLTGSEVSDALMKLTTVEFSYYMGFPVQQIAEPFHYPMLNTSHSLRFSWVRTVLLGVLDTKASERTFQANMERRVAMLLGEAMGLVRRVKRATTVGNSSVQVVSVNQLEGDDHPLEVIYFVEDPSGERIPAVQTASLLNSLDVQKAAIVLGYRVQGILAQPVEKVAFSSSDNGKANMWIIIGVVIPLMVVIVIISILYWKMCRTDKLEFQPDAMTSIQQRQKSTTSLEGRNSPSHQSLPPTKKDLEFSEEEEEWQCEEEEEYEEYNEDEEEDEEEDERGKKSHTLTKSSMSSEDEGDEEEEEMIGNLGSSLNPKQQNGPGIAKTKKLQTPSVKGFDFAKLHLGQHNKDDVMVIQESIPPGSGPAPLPLSLKDGPSPLENGEIPVPVSKKSASITKASRSRLERISPSDAESVVSDRSCERDAPEENLRAQGTPSDSKQNRKNPINVLNGPPPMNGTSEPLSSASIFEHVDRMSRATDASRKLPNKVQLIAMQPMPLSNLHKPAANGHLPDANHINKEVALRQKSEIEHHRNKIRLRAKRKGHYDFPAMDEVNNGFGDVKEKDRIYQKAQLQIDKILDPNTQMPCIFMEPKKSSARGRRSPKLRTREQMNGRLADADKDHLINEDAEAVYRKCPGVNNVAFVSDPDQMAGSPHRSPSPTDDVFLGPTSSPPGHAPPPPPYMPPQPSIEEARQQMHSLLDDAFALVSPTSQCSTAGITLPGVHLSDSSPPGRNNRHWGHSYQSPFPSRFSELSLSPPAVQGLMQRQGLGSSFLPPGEPAGLGEQLQSDSLYTSRGHYAEELTSSARPRPVGGSSGAQLHHLTQVGLSSRMNGFPAGVRGHQGQNGVAGWSSFHDDGFSRSVPEKDTLLDFPYYPPRSIFQTTRSGAREPSAPPVHLDTSASYMSAPPPMDTIPPPHSSASLIKAIREELSRLSQKQAAVSGYRS
ncbi:UPF0606 protein KIAA1549 isoform X2 [Synchiropus splendidus]|uniref:UPF0606 protein KIAA1549 isoform X2 n=1 Tax=Synchiropus splendidus TaxID=270530 RepID=UPI00237DBA48|nr:UPF0606 protein KIAA1549 isoform X2 [Synchiropus splendidus]